MKYIASILALCLLLLGGYVWHKDNKLKKANLTIADMEQFYSDMLKMQPDTVVEIRTIESKSVRVIHIVDTTDMLNMATYNDSIVNDSINVSIEITALKLGLIRWKYKPLTTERTVTIEKQIPIYNKCPEIAPEKVKPFSIMVGVGTNGMPLIGGEYKRFGVIATYTDKPLLMGFYKF